MMRMAGAPHGQQQKGILCWSLLVGLPWSIVGIAALVAVLWAAASQLRDQTRVCCFRLALNGEPRDPSLTEAWLLICQQVFHEAMEVSESLYRRSRQVEAVRRSNIKPWSWRERELGIFFQVSTFSSFALHTSTIIASPSIGSLHTPHLGTVGPSS